MPAAAIWSEVTSKGHQRSNNRYPIAADVAYQLPAGRSGFGEEGTGLTVNISSSGILLKTETALPVGVPIALQIDWPAKLNREIALTLHVRGRTHRSDRNRTAVVIMRHEFRTRRLSLDADAVNRPRLS